VIPVRFAESVAAALPGARSVVIPRVARAIIFESTKDGAPP
jgi:hypothetical protein